MVATPLTSRPVRRACERLAIMVPYEPLKRPPGPARPALVGRDAGPTRQRIIIRRRRNSDAPRAVP